MQFIEGEAYHIYNRGNNQQTIFFNDENYRFFLGKIRKLLCPYCDIIAYCLMPNHFHLIIYVKILDEEADPMTQSHRISKAIAVLLRSYTRAIQKQEHFTGSLFQQKTKARKLYDETLNYTISALLICIHYVHQNPVRAKLVISMEDWEFSSYRDYANLRTGGLCNKMLRYALSDLREVDFIQESLQMLRYSSDDFAGYSSDDSKSSDE